MAPGEWMFAAAFQRCRESYEVIASYRMYLNDLWTSLGEGARLVESDEGCAAEAFESFTAAYEDAEVCATSGGGHDGGWNREAHRAGAGDDEYRNGCGEGLYPACGWGKSSPREKG